jgi:mannose-1-phosphate guanylyltransferase
LVINRKLKPTKNNILDHFNEISIPRTDLIPIILSGGSGSRLWPLSRKSYPKQYLNLDESNSLSLIQNTYLRLKGINSLKDPIIISNEEQRFIVAEQMRQINITPDSILLEPFGRSTAPAVTLAALKALSNYDDPLLLVLSSDHKIEDPKAFQETINQGITEAVKDRLVTFGIVPSNAETGYGYIESYEKLSIENPHSKIKSFVEKPSLKLAKKFINDKHFSWNSGIFLFKASTFISELEKFEPEIINTCNNSLKKGVKDLDFIRINEEYFKKCPNKSIDIALMEKTSLGTVLRLNCGWDDIGSWKSVWKNSKKNKEGNSLKGKVIIKDSRNCYLRSEGRLIVGINLNDIIVVETSDAILVADKESSQKIKKTVQLLNESNFKEGKKNKKSFRPWGSFTCIEEGDSWQVKRLEIKPKASISLQKHHKRSEHWIVVDGLAKVEIDGNTSFLKKNESTYIPLGSKHRLSNPGESHLILIEVQSGNYLGEDDIVRFEDIYGRSNK